MERETGAWNEKLGHGTRNFELQPRTYVTLGRVECCRCRPAQGGGGGVEAARRLMRRQSRMQQMVGRCRAVGGDGGGSGGVACNDCDCKGYVAAPLQFNARRRSIGAEGVG